MRKTTAFGAALVSVAAAFAGFAAAPASAVTPRLDVATAWGALSVVDKADTANKVDVRFYSNSGPTAIVQSNTPITPSSGCVSTPPGSGFQFAAACNLITSYAKIELRGGDDTFYGDFTGTMDVYGGSGVDTLTGGYVSQVNLYGEAGNDTLTANGYSSMYGGDDADTITGSDFRDTIDGGSGGDTLKGWGGPDTITGGSGSDIIRGNEGLDTVFARDGEWDDVDCGGGAKDKAATDDAPPTIIRDRRVSCEKPA